MNIFDVFIKNELAEAVAMARYVKVFAANPVPEYTASTEFVFRSAPVSAGVMVRPLVRGDMGMW